MTAVRLLAPLFVIAIAFFAQNSANAQDKARGEVIYRSCIECHGVHGEGLKSKDAPKIGGQFDWYIASSVKQFQAGERKNPVMLPSIKGLSEQDVQDVSLYVSTLSGKEEK